MNYLTFRERAAENLQFFLWYRDYCRRFAELPAHERALAPEWTAAQAATDTDLVHQHEKSQVKPSPHMSNLLKGTDFNGGGIKTKAQSMDARGWTPPRTPNPAHADAVSTMESSAAASLYDPALSSIKGSYAEKAAGAFEAAGLKWQPCTPLSWL